MSTTLRYTLRLLTLCGAVVISLIIAELLFRFILSVSDVRVSQNSEARLPDTRTFRFHPILGISGIPNVSVTEHSPLAPLIETNSRGFRTTEFSIEKPIGKKRVLLIGDSQAWGTEVEYQRTIQANLQQLLGNTYEVISLGISGYGIDQSYLMYLLLGETLTPDYVIFIYFTENDYVETMNTRIWNAYKPYFTVHNGDLCLNNFPVKAVDGWENHRIGFLLPQFVGHFEDYSYLLKFLLNRYIHPTIVNAGEKITFKISSLLCKRSLIAGDYCRIQTAIQCINPEPQAEKPNHRNIPYEILRRLHSRVSQTATFAILQKPALSELITGQVGQSFPSLERFCSLEKIDYLDTGKAITSSPMNPGDYFAPYHHFSPLGTKLSAFLVRDWIVKKESSHQ